MKVHIPIQIISFFAFLDVILGAAVGKLPPTFKTCQRKDPQLDKCLQKNILLAVKDLVPGYVPLGVNPIDPLTIIALDIDQGQGPVSINLKFRDLKIYGFRNSELHHVRADLRNYKVSAKVKIPKLELRGQYIIDGKVLILPIKGSGPCLLTLDNIAADIDITGKEVKKNGKIYMEFEKFGFTLNPKRLTMKFDNLFNGDKALGDNMNRFLNENWDEILKELKPAVQEAFGQIFAQVSNRIFLKVPFDDIFPQ